MDKKNKIVLSILIVVLFANISFLSAFCDLDAVMINQDPYPAVPGDYVRLIFQVTGVENPDCGYVSFELLPEYPISFDPNTSSKVVVKSGTFVKNFTSSLIVPYKVRVDSNALDGDNPLEVKFSSGLIEADVFKLKQFNLYAEDVKVDFEIHIKNYDITTNTITFEVLNIGSSDIEALTVEVPNQKNIVIKGANKNIVGGLDSNDFTTAEFEAIPTKGDINLILHYTDIIDERRTANEVVSFDPTFFEERKKDEKKRSSLTYVIIFLVVVFIIYFIYTRSKRKEKRRF